MSDNYVVTKIVPEYGVKYSLDGLRVCVTLTYEDQEVSFNCASNRVVDSMVVLEHFAGVVIDEYAAKRSANDNPPSNL